MNCITTNRHGVYKVRIRIKQELQGFFNRKEINKSLETKSYQEAVKKGGVIISQYTQILTTQRANMLTDEQIQEIVNDYITNTLKQDKLDRAVSGFGTLCIEPDTEAHCGNHSQAMAAELSTFLSDYKQELADCNYDSMKHVAANILKPLNITYSDEEPTHRLLLQELLIGQIEIFEEAISRYEGKFSKRYITSPVKKSTKKTSNEAPMSNEQAVFIFLKNYKDSVSQTQYGDVSNFLNNVFLQIIDANESVSDATLEDLLDIRETLSKLPKRNIQRYREMTTHELIEHKTEANERISKRTLDKYIKWLKMFYSFCYENNYIPKNPIVSMSTATNGDALDERLPLELTEIRALFSVAKDDKVLLNGLKTLAYTGMRLSEIYKAKIKTHNGIKCFDLTDKTIKLKTKSSHRIIPIHNEIDTDMLDSLYTKSLFSKKANALIRKEVSDNPKKVLYSLRHSFASVLKNKQVPHDVVSELMGHSHHTMTFSRYASSYDVNILKEAINKLQY